jgi:hypothetical protein
MSSARYAYVPVENITSISCGCNHIKHMEHNVSLLYYILIRNIVSADFNYGYTYGKYSNYVCNGMYNYSLIFKYF